MITKGTRIRLVAMPDDPRPIEVGATGTVVQCMDFPNWNPSWTQIQVQWDNGRGLSLCVPPDRFEVISE